VEANISKQTFISFFQGEEESWSMGGRAAGGGPDRGKKGQTEVEVIRDWFVNIFQPVEKTADLVRSVLQPETVFLVVCHLSMNELCAT
jgi:hypothetical protein